MKIDFLNKDQKTIGSEFILETLSFEKIARTIRFFQEKNGFEALEVVLKMIEDKKMKTLKSTLNSLSDTKINDFLKAEFNEKIEEDFISSDLIGWTIKNGFDNKDYSKALNLTFEKEGKLKQYRISMWRFLKRDFNLKYDFISNGKTYNYRNEFEGNTFELIEEFKEKIKDIKYVKNSLQITTNKGWIEFMAGEKVLFIENEEVEDCPFENQKEELYFICKQSIGEEIRIEILKRRGDSLVGTLYGERISENREEHINLVCCYKVLAQRMCDIVNKTKDFKRLNYAYSSFEEIFSDFKELDVEGLYIDFKKQKKEADKMKALALKKQKENKILVDKIKEENNFKKTIEFNGTSFNINSFVSLDSKNEFENIHIQLKFNDVYIKGTLDTYYNKYFTIANIKINSIQDKEKWSENTFSKMCNIIKQYIEKDFNDILAGQDRFMVLETVYGLDNIFKEYTWGCRKKAKKGSDKEFCLSQIPEGMIG